MKHTLFDILNIVLVKNLHIHIYVFIVYQNKHEIKKYSPKEIYFYIIYSLKNKLFEEIHFLNDCLPSACQNMTMELLSGEKIQAVKHAIAHGLYEYKTYFKIFPKFYIHMLILQ